MKSPSRAGQRRNSLRAPAKAASLPLHICPIAALSLGRGFGLVDGFGSSLLRQLLFGLADQIEHFHLLAVCLVNLDPQERHRARRQRLAHPRSHHPRRALERHHRRALLPGRPHHHHVHIRDRQVVGHLYPRHAGQRPVQPRIVQLAHDHLRHFLPNHAADLFRAHGHVAISRFFGQRIGVPILRRGTGRRRSYTKSTRKSVKTTLDASRTRSTTFASAPSTYARSVPTIATPNTQRRCSSWASVSAMLTLNPPAMRSLTLRMACRLS